MFHKIPDKSKKFIKTKETKAKLQERDDVDIKHDVPMVGIYNKTGKVYLDRTAASVLTPSEIRDVEIHERIELTKRLEGKSYEQAHSETQEMFPFSVNLQDKLHRVAVGVMERIERHPETAEIPRDMYGARIYMDGGGATSGDEVHDDLEKELVRRKLEDGRLQPVFLEDISDDKLERMMDQRKTRDDTQRLRDRALNVLDEGTKRVQQVANTVEEREAEREEADLMGRSMGVNPGLQAGMTVTAAPKELYCRKDGITFKPGDKVFKKVFNYYCPRCGHELEKPPSARKSKNPLGDHFNIGGKRLD